MASFSSRPAKGQQSLTNDDHCVNQLQGRLLTQSTTQEQTLNTLIVNFPVVNLVTTAPGHSQKKEVICEKCFLCHSVVLCQTCNMCPKCCSKSACQGQTSKFLENIAGSRCRSESSSNLERGLHPSFPDPAKSYKVSLSHKLLCQSSQEQLPVRGITSAYRQKCPRAGPKSDISGVFQPTFFSPKAQQSPTHIRSEQTESTRLRVRLRGRPVPTDTGPVAEPSGQNTGNSFTTDLPGPAIHVPDRFTNSHREASSPGPTSYETHTVASQKQLARTRVTRNGDSNSQVPAPRLTMVARRGQCSHRPAITSNKICSSNLYRRIKRRVGHSLKRTHRQRGVVTATKQAAHKLPGTKGSFPSFETVSRPLYRQDSSCSNRQHYGCVVHKQGGGMRLGPLCALLWRILTWCTRKQVTLKARHIPGRLNVVADKLSRLGQTIQTEWSLLQEVFQTICRTCHRPQID